MSGTINNPLVAQGTLNRVRCSVVAASFTPLNIASSNMGKSFATISFEGTFADQIETATGVVNSPQPYVMASIVVGLLRTQALSGAWLAQSQDTSTIGGVTIHSDTAAFAPISIDSAVIREIAPGAFDGTDPVVRLTLRGRYLINNSLWTFN